MNVLGVDTTTDMGSIGVTRGDQLLAEITISMRHSHLELLIPLIQETLNKACVETKSVDLFAVVLGPGSWTGIRIGVTTLKTIAQAIEKPIVGVCSLDVMAQNCNFTQLPVITTMDAARKFLYFGCYDNKGSLPKRVGEYQYRPAKELFAGITTPTLVLGSSLNRYQKEIAANPNIILPNPSQHMIKAEHVCQAALEKFMTRGPDDTLSLVPLYLQQSDAERAWDQKLAATEAP